MLLDHWVFSQLLLQGFSLFLMLYAMAFSWKIIRAWSPASMGELQLNLEKNNYLVSAIVQYVLFFQLILFFLFLFIVNRYLPDLIKGAMCATGTLQANNYGFTALYVKCLSLIVYAIYLFINEIENRQPDYLLTPGKFFWVEFCGLLMIADFSFSFLYFIGLKPDIITTCCGAEYLDRTAKGSLTAGGVSTYHLLFFIGIFILLILMFFFQLKKREAPELFQYFQLLLSLNFVWAAILSLKTHFVKFIYGLPTHSCLFDIFWPKYYFIGYVLFLAYFGILFCSIFIFLLFIFKKQYGIERRLTLKKLHILHLIFALVAFCIPMIYWFLWKGNLV